jgi:DNA primase
MSTKTGWIDFRELCKRVRFADVLKLYNVELKIKGDQAQGFCPLPGHGGQKRSPSFSVNLGKGIWQCFGCSAKGNLLDFVARMEGLDPFKGRDVRKAAELLQEKLGIGSAPSPQPAKDPIGNGGVANNSATPPTRDKTLPIVVNAPLDFELKNLDMNHPYLSQRGFTPETIREFGLGYCNRGMFKGRIVIPIHDDKGALVGYAGRVVDDRAISEENPKYKLPAPREHDGKLYEFHKSLLLYNAHRVKQKVSDLIVVEGFPAVWWLRQHGYNDVVAVMGSDCSEEQSLLILERVEFDGRIWILTDGDPAGVRCAEQLLARCAPYRFVRWAKLQDGQQPTDCNLEDLQSLLGV